ncbi:NAD(P)H-quinone oxidoreductase subunit K chloroplastic [Bienertia sinuspersici]
MKMSSLSRVGLGLSVVFICLLLALIAEIYYLLWWKKRIIKREIEANYRKPRRELCYCFCWKKEAISSPSINNSRRIPNTQNNKDYTLTSLDENGVVGTELMLNGPPRFLFTINEETREDLESEDGKSREGKRRSLSDLLKKVESSNTPTYLSPISSPRFITPPITPIGSCHSSQSGGYNPFYESSNDAEFNKIVKYSPPPKFQFLRDAEDKLQRKIMLMEEAKKEANLLKKSEEDGSFIRIIVAKNKENDNNANHHYHSPHLHSGDSSSSQVFSLPSSSSSASSPNRKFKNFLTL